MGQEQALWDVSLDVDVVGLRAEVARVSVAPDREDEIDRFVAEGVEDGLEEIGRAVVEDGPERRVDGDRLRERVKPFERLGSPFTKNIGA